MKKILVILSMTSEEFVKKVHVSEIEGSSRRARRPPLRRIKSCKLKEHMCERGDDRG